MTISFEAGPAPHVGAARSRLRLGAGVVLRIVRRIVIDMRRRRDYARLAELTDDLLDDVGLTRADIDAARAATFVAPWSRTKGER